MRRPTTNTMFGLLYGTGRRHAVADATVTLRLLERHSPEQQVIDAVFRVYNRYRKNVLAFGGQPLDYTDWSISRSKPARGSAYERLVTSRRSGKTALSQEFIAATRDAKPEPILWYVSENGKTWYAAVSLSSGPESDWTPDVWRSARLTDGRDIAVKYWSKNAPEVMRLEFLEARSSKNAAMDFDTFFHGNRK